MTNVYCTAPWNGLTVREDGHVKTCCNGSVNIANLNRDSIFGIADNARLKQIQDTMIGGQPDQENCGVCVQQEKNTGLASLRQYYLENYPNINIDQLDLQVLDIRWNNTCNLGCLYCSPKFSSTWCERENVIHLKPVKSYQDDLLKFVLDHADSVKEIMLVGGEPMLMKQNYRLFERLPDTTKISIITNLSYDLEQLPCFEALTSRPKENLAWNVSCDNVEQQFEYVRSGAKWDNLKKNIQLLNRHWPDSINMLMVYSVFSAFDLDRTLDVFHSLGVRKFSLQTYFGKPAMDVFKMPAGIRQHALEVLSRSIELHKHHVEQFVHPEDQNFYQYKNTDSILRELSRLVSNSAVTKQQFFNELQWYNQWSNVKFENLWPHVMDLVNEHLD